MTTGQQQICETNLIAAYVDGELENDTSALFEQHLQSCLPCRDELRAHQLFVCQLDAALTNSVELAVPDDFSRVIAARAASDMSGVRTRSEHRKALGICLLLGGAGFALLGTTARDSLFLITGRFVTRMLAIAVFLLGVVYDTVAGLIVISRAVSRRAVVETRSLAAMLVLLAVAILILSRLISNYHRTSATE